MEHRGNGPRQHTALTFGPPMLAAALAVVAAALAADAVAYGAWRGLVFVVALVAAVPLLRRVPAREPRRVSPGNPVRASIPPGLRSANEVLLILLPAFSPFLAFGMSEGCGGCPQALWAQRAMVVGSVLIGAVYLWAQRRRSTPERALAVAGWVIPALVLLFVGAMAFGGG